MTYIIRKQETLTSRLSVKLNAGIRDTASTVRISEHASVCDLNVAIEEAFCGLPDAFLMLSTHPVSYSEPVSLEN